MMTRSRFVCSAGTACVLACLAWATVSAQNRFPDPNTCRPAECGEVSPLIPMQSAEAVHMGLVWKKNSQNPKILFHSRFPEYTPNDVADPALIDLAIELRGVLNAWTPVQLVASRRAARLRSVPGSGK